MRWLTAWDTGDPQPTAATLNDKAGLITSNSAVVPAGTSGSIDIFVTDPTDVIVDINGYYALPSDLVGNTAFGIDALMNNTTGSNNTANGNYALQNNTTGSGNTANGAMALQSNSTGIDNTATGYLALFHNTTGNNNTATGEQALIFNTTGSSNVADGLGALTSNTTGSANTATGAFALWNNTTGGGNTATGENALTNNTTGIDNTACGAEALTFNTTGNNNIAVGHSAAYNVLSINSNNIHVGSEGSAADNGAIRIGTAGTQTSFFEAGVRGVTTSNPDAIPVIIDSAGQLGTASSSRRVKRDIEDMGDTTDTILALHPVRFHYQAHGFNSPLQYGLIAEEVAEIAPDLVARNKDGEIETVYYDKVNAMLLNEVQKLHREKDGLADAVRSLADTVRTLESRLAAVEDKAKYATSPSFAARTRPRFEPVAIPVGDTLARPELFACADAYPE